MEFFSRAFACLTKIKYTIRDNTDLSSLTFESLIAEAINELRKNEKFYLQSTGNEITNGIICPFCGTLNKGNTCTSCNTSINFK